MFLRLPKSPDLARRRFSGGGVDLYAGDGVSILAPEDTMIRWTESGVQLLPSADTLETEAVVQVRKNCVAVELNPKVGEILGMMPGVPQYLHPGWFGAVGLSVLGLTDDQRAAILGLDWLVELHFVPVTTLND